MCGIAGFVGEGDKETLAGMIRTIAYRGPDDTGIWHEGNVGLAHARLSIIDLSPLGHQPMHSTDGTVSIVFNGEIYNFQALRAELESKGRIFKSRSDTEVIIQMYESFGDDAFARLEGMFAFGLYDKNIDTLFLVRDRFGEKPLYWAHQNGVFIFASEPKALFGHKKISKQINPHAIDSYLTYDAILTPGSIFKGVHKVEAATILSYTKGRITKRAYWSPESTPLNSSFGESVSALDTAFSKSVSAQLVADVPVGVFLSGGLDSSIIAYYAQKQAKNPIHTFAIGFEDASYDESPYAREVARSLGTVHHERIVSADEMREALDLISQRVDEPIADPAIVPNYLLAHFAREQVKVALGGDGGDELFGGYQTFTAERLLSWYTALPAVVRKKIIEPLVERLPVSHRYFSFDFKAKQFLRGASVPEKYVHQSWLESFNSHEKREILSPEYKEALSHNAYERIDEYASEISGDVHMQRAYFYIRTYLLDVILTKVDRSSMFNSLEVRSPFLDRNLAETALKLPWHYKHRGTTGKYILRELMRGRLPKRVIQRGKHGFGLPIGQWFRKEWREMLCDVVSPGRIQASGVFDPQAVERIVAQHLEGTHNHRKKLWSLFMFQMWYDGFLRK
jgi:asparagine synthase (glutamine-hydrolysing)